MPHDVYTIGIPLLAILAGILLNRSDVHGLRAEIHADIKGLRDEMRAEIHALRTEMRENFGVVHADLRSFYSLTGELKGRVDELSKHP